MSSPRSATIEVAVIEVAVIGAGPRGTVTTERLCANAVGREGLRVRVHVIDPYEAGPGRVWRRDQPEELLMNSVATDVTAFLDESVQCAGPVTTGPSQYEWAKASADELPAPLGAEAGRMKPWSYPSRVLHGTYLRWAFERAVAGAPEHVEVVEHRCSASGLGPFRPDGKRMLTLSDGTRLGVDAVILAVGHYDNLMDVRAADLAANALSHGVTYLPPGSAADADLSSISGSVITYGMGLTFFDYLARLTVGRGGRFEERGDELVYLPSGKEPKIFAASRQGVPYRARPEYRCDTLPVYRARYFTPDFGDEVRARAGSAPADFRKDVWPTLQRELTFAWYSVALGDCPAVEERLAALLDDPDADLAGLADRVDVEFRASIQHLDWDELLTPVVGHEFVDEEHFPKWLEGLLIEDLAAAHRGPQRDPSKALAAAMRDLRGVVRRIVSHGGVSGHSYRHDMEGWFNGVNNMLASGPPSERLREVLALMGSGALEFIGPCSPPELDPETGEFVVESSAVAGSRRSARAALEAFLPVSDVSRAADPFLQGLLADGHLRPYVIADGGSRGGYRSGGIEIDPDSLRVVDRAGATSDPLFCFGPPVEGVQWVTASSARPHVNSPLLVQADVIARSALRL